MMDLNLFSLVLVAVAFATALNLWMTFRLAARMRDLAAPAMTVPIGALVPPFEGIVDGRAFRASDMAGRPSVLVFLSPGCKTCAGHVGDLVALLPGAARAGVSMWIVPADDVHDIARLVGDGPLSGHVLRLNDDARLRLNPLKVVPFYLFLDDALYVRASNFLGDGNWTTFVDEIRGPAG